MQVGGSLPAPRGSNKPHQPASPIQALCFTAHHTIWGFFRRLCYSSNNIHPGFNSLKHKVQPLEMFSYMYNVEVTTAAHTWWLNFWKSSKCHMFMSIKSWICGYIDRYTWTAHNYWIYSHVYCIPGYIAKSYIHDQYKPIYIEVHEAKVSLPARKSSSIIMSSFTPSFDFPSHFPSPSKLLLCSTVLL